ncbi:MAG: DUF4294 domain-containing protein [Salinivirgaceae bacterium]|nr:DUF4294 domain-containing protein [Salinivirgaceae bacterium]
MQKLVSILFVLAAFTCSAQTYENLPQNVVQYEVIDGDTIFNVKLSTVTVRAFKNKKQEIQYTRLVRNVKKAYPYSIIARNEIDTLNRHLESISGDHERKKYMKEYEKEMFRRYEDELRNLTISQGKIIIKLVYREFDNTAFQMVKDYRGSFSAVFWQGVAKLFRSDLKKMYDPETVEEDKMIEEIIELIELGMI